MQTFLVCYDIADPKRLRKVAGICEDFGYRKQKSVFLVRLGATDAVRLRTRLYEAINLTHDQVLFVPVCQACLTKIEAIGQPTDPPAATDIVMVV